MRTDFAGTNSVTFAMFHLVVPALFRRGIQFRLRHKGEIELCGVFRRSHDDNVATRQGALGPTKIGHRNRRALVPMAQDPRPRVVNAFSVMASSSGVAVHHSHAENSTFVAATKYDGIPRLTFWLRTISWTCRSQCAHGHHTLPCLVHRRNVTVIISNFGNFSNLQATFPFQVSTNGIYQQRPIADVMTNDSRMRRGLLRGE